jgi:hypothetical protein
MVALDTTEAASLASALHQAVTSAIDRAVSAREPAHPTNLITFEGTDFQAFDCHK